MRAMPTTATAEWRFMGQGEVSPRPFGGTESELSLYRGETAALLRRYVRASVEVGRLPSVLGREFFRSKGSSNTNRNFEDVVIFVTDMERAIDKLTALDKKLLFMNVLEEYYIPDMARLLSCNERTVRRGLQNALDNLSELLLAGEMMGEIGCQEGKNYKRGVSRSKEGENKVR